MKATEKVSQETMPWSISSTNAVSVKDSRSPKLRDKHTHTHTQPMYNLLWMDSGVWCRQRGEYQRIHKEERAHGKRWKDHTLDSRGRQGTRSQPEQKN